MSALPGNLYEQAFAQGLKPKDVVATLTARLRQSEDAAVSISEWLDQRAAIEHDFVKRLSKLSARPILQPEGFAPELISQLEAELASSIKSHSAFASKLESTVSAPLIQNARAGESRIKQYASEVSAVANEHDAIASKVAKAQAKGSISSKKQAQLVTNRDDLSFTLANWLEATPNYFKAVQQGDRARLESIKENLAKFQTLVSDLGRETLEGAERGMLSVLSWEPEDEMQNFVLKSGARLPSRTPAASANTGTNGHGTTQRQPPPDANPAPLARRDSQSSFRPPPSLRSNRSSHRDSSSVKQGGLFSTLSSKIKPSMNRNRSSSYGNIDGPAHLPTRAKPAPASHSQGHATDETFLMASTGFGSGPTTPMVEESDSINTPTPTKAFAPSAKAAGKQKELSVERPDKEKRQSALPFGLGRRLSVATKSAASHHELQNAPPPLPELPESSPRSEPAKASTQSKNPFLEQTQPEVPLVVQTPPANVDAEGYTVPPPDHNREPWSGGSLFDEPASISTAPKVDISQQPISPARQESAADRDAALERVKSTLLSASPVLGGPNRRSTLRGRRDVRNSYQPSLSQTDDVPLSALTIPSNSTFSPSSTVLTQSPSDMVPASSIPPSFSASPTRANGRTGSVLSLSSSRELAASPVNPFDHPEAPGLRASITETVSVLYKQGSTPRVIVSGEIALLFKGSPTTLHIKLDRFQHLESLLPNSTFLYPTSGAQPGEYTLDASALNRAVGPATVLKYHLQVPSENANAFIPLQVTPQWKCEADRTLLLISYSVNSASALTASNSSSPFEDAAAFKDLALSVPVTSSAVTDLQTKPTAIYTDKRRLIWKLDDLPLDDREQHKALAKFSVPEQSQPQPVSVKWKVPGRLFSGIGLEVQSPEGPVNFEELVQATQSGKYLFL